MKPLPSICRTYGINKTTLLKVNNLRSKKLTRGQYLRIPYNVASYQLLPEGSKMALAGNKSNLILHRIKAGESISQIATRYNVSPKEIVAWNNLGSANRISAGQQLALYPGNKTILTVPGELMAEPVEDDTSSIASSGKDSLQKTRVLTADKKKVTRSLAALPTGRTKTSTQVAGMKKNTVKIAQLSTVKTISTPAVQKRKSTSLDIASRPAPVKTAVTLTPTKKKTIGANAPEGDRYSWYKVKQGDTLWTISKKFNTSSLLIKEWNNLKTNVIRPGSQLKVKNA